MGAKSSAAGCKTNDQWQVYRHIVVTVHWSQFKSKLHAFHIVQPCIVWSLAVIGIMAPPNTSKSTSWKHALVVLPKFRLCLLQLWLSVYCYKSLLSHSVFTLLQQISKPGLCLTRVNFCQVTLRHQAGFYCWFQLNFNCSCNLGSYKP